MLKIRTWNNKNSYLCNSSPTKYLWIYDNMSYVVNTHKDSSGNEIAGNRNLNLVFPCRNRGRFFSFRFQGLITQVSGQDKQSSSKPATTKHQYTSLLVKCKLFNIACQLVLEQVCNQTNTSNLVKSIQTNTNNLVKSFEKADNFGTR